MVGLGLGLELGLVLWSTTCEILRENQRILPVKMQYSLYILGT